MASCSVVVLLLFTALIRSSESQQDFYCNEPFDIVLLLDSSLSFGKDNFAALITYSKIFIEYFNLRDRGPGPYIGFLPYSDDINRGKLINFRYSRSRKMLKSAIDRRISFDGGRESRLDFALQGAQDVFFKPLRNYPSQGSRPWVHHVVLAITGSWQTWSPGVRQRIKREARRLQRQGVKLLLAAIGQPGRNDRALLESLVHSGDDLFVVTSPYRLVDVTENMVQKLCPVPSVLPCPGTVDIAFIVDSSGSISSADYDKTKYFVYSIAKALNVSHNTTHAGVVIYSTEARMKIKFTDHNDIASFQEAVYGLEHMEKFTRIDLGLRVAHTELFSPIYGGARPRVKKLAFILTDGIQNPVEVDGVNVSVGGAAQPLKDAGIKTFSVGIGRKVNRVELRAMVEFDEDLITVANFDELIKKIQNITQQTCEEIIYSKCYYPADIAFVLDSSTSVRDVDFEKTKSFVKTMAKLFRIFQYGSRGAVINYGDRAVLSIRMDAHKTYRGFIDAVERLTRVGGTRRTYKALGLAEDVLTDYSSGARRKVPKVVLLLTAGPESNSREFALLKQLTDQLHGRNTIVLVVGIGPGVNTNDVISLVQSSVDLFLAKSFTELKNQLVPLTNETCKNVGPGKCEAKVDLAFILDSSGSIEGEAFAEAKDFIVKVAQTFTISPQKTHVALMIYSDQAQIMKRFGEINSQRSLRTDLDALPHLKGKTRIDLALKMAGTSLFSSSGGMRSSSTVAKVAIVITDGRQTPAPDGIRLDEAAARLLVNGVKVLSIGIGDNIDQEELNMMVENPEKYTFWAESYRALKVQLATIARESCSLKTFTG